MIMYFLYTFMPSNYPIIASFIMYPYVYLVFALPFLFFFANIVNPGYILSHQIQLHEYTATEDPKRPLHGKFCDFCQLFINRATYHCFRCNHCVANYDHHCSIMVKCVGGVNLAVFYLFVLAINAVYMSSIAIVIYDLIWGNKVSK